MAASGEIQRPPMGSFPWPPSTEGVGLAPLTDDHEECGIGRHWFHGLGSAKAEDREVAAEAFDRIAATLGREGGTT
jgi:hypothetical protein